MATDNRHRPGPGFRCPTCWGSDITAYGRGKRVRAGKFSHRRQVLCRCSCGREWKSKHKRAIELYENPPRIDYPRLLNHEEKVERGLA